LKIDGLFEEFKNLKFGSVTHPHRELGGSISLLLPSRCIINGSNQYISIFGCVLHYVAQCALYWRVSFGVYLLVIFIDSFTCIDEGTFRLLLSAYIKVFGDRIFKYPLKTPVNRNYRNSISHLL
jgi:hypothetical protein